MELDSTQAKALRTDLGTVLLTGDYKFDQTPVDGVPADMARLAQLGAEDAGLVLLKLRADQLHVLGRIQKAVRRAVQRNKALAAGHIIEQRGFLLGRYFGGVRVDEQTVVAAK